MTIYRIINHTWAAMFGYFWLHCPLCGHGFGGHQWRDIDGKSSCIYPDPHSPHTAQGICPDCTRAGKGEPPPLPQI